MNILKIFAIACFIHTGLVSAAAIDDAKAGLEAQDRNDDNEAIRLYTKALDATSEPLDNRLRAIALNNRGNAHVAKGRHDEGIADFNAALKIQSNYSNAIHSRALAYVEKKEYDKAFADFNEAIKISPSNPRFYNSRGQSWRTKGEFQKAMADYSKALEINPTYVEAHYHRGMLWMDQKEYSRAIEDYSEALVDNPRHIKSLQARAEARRGKGDATGAAADDATAAKLVATSTPKVIKPHATPEGNLTAGFTALILRDFPTALAYYKAGADQNDPGCMLNLAVMTHYGQGTPKDTRQANVWLEKSIADGRMFSLRAMKHNFGYYRDLAEKGYPTAQYVAGRAYAEYADGDKPTGDMEKARDWLNKAASNGVKPAGELLAAINAPPRQSSSVSARADRNTGPSMHDQVMATMKRQRNENCIAAAKGANRVCRY